MTDPFDEVQPPATRRFDHPTSIAAAKAVSPVRGPIAREVLEYARFVGGEGFTDDELKTWKPDAPESSYRKRRTELAAAGYLHSCGDQRKNRNGRLELIWRITDKGRMAL
jgi:hypothetical protein